MPENSLKCVLIPAIFQRDKYSIKEFQKILFLHFQHQIFMSIRNWIMLGKSVKLNRAKALSKFSHSYIPRGGKLHCLSECNSHSPQRGRCSLEESSYHVIQEILNIPSPLYRHSFWNTLSKFYSCIIISSLWRQKAAAKPVAHFRGELPLMQVAKLV